MFCFTARTLLDNLQRHAPELHAAAERCWAATPEQSGDAIRINAENFAALPAISIDYAVMEKTSGVAVVRAGFAWSDVGSWNAVSELTPPDADGNRTVGDAAVGKLHGAGAGAGLRG